MPDPTAQNRPDGRPDPYATWDPSQATDAPDGLPDRAIVPLVESLRSRGIFTLQSCAGHPGTDDGCLWVRADTVDGAHIRLFLLPDQQRREVFHRVQFVYWPEQRWEFVWPADHAERAMAALDGLLPAVAPEPAAQEPPADAAPTTGAPDGTAIPGRALRDESGDLWVQTGPDAWQAPAADDSWSRSEIEATYGRTAEVLLVIPAAARVLDAARRWFASISMTETAEEADLALALCGLDGYKSAEHVTNLAAAVDAAETGGPELGTEDAFLAALDQPDKAAPEPAADGPGWERPSIEGWLDFLEHGPEETRDQESADQLRALLADRDRLYAAAQAWAREGCEFEVQRDHAERERDAARAELAEVTADRDRHKWEFAWLLSMIAAAVSTVCNPPDGVEIGKPDVRKLEAMLQDTLRQVADD